MPETITTKQQYRRYLEEVQRLVPLDPNPHSAQGVRLARLAKLVEDYEKERFLESDRQKRTG